MKTVLIIYGISWIILLVVYLSSKLKKKKEQYNNPFNRKSKEPWYFYLAMILFAPLIILVIPYILIDEHIKDKAQKKRDAEWEEEKRKEELKKKESENDFLKSVSLKDYDIIIECVLLGKASMNWLKQIVMQMSLENLMLLSWKKDVLYKCKSAKKNGLAIAVNYMSWI